MAVRRKRALPKQVGLFERGTWGGARPNAGRKAAKRPKDVSHKKRPAHEERYPLHVTLGAKVTGLRQRGALGALQRQVRRVRRCDRCRFESLVHAGNLG